MSGRLGDVTTKTETAHNGTVLAINETERLIASDKVEGTAIYDHAGNHLGTVQNLMIDKYSGQVAYVVISFGGFLSIGSQYHALPWKKLSYDSTMGGYVTDLTRDQLQHAPRYTADEQPWDNPDYGRSVYDYYGLPFYM